MPQVTAAGSATPDTGSGGSLTQCRITAWSGARSTANAATGTLARLTIETAEEDIGSPYAARWAAGGALQERREQEARFEEVIAEAQGYVSERPVGSELWDHEHADTPGYDLSGYDEIGAHGKRDIYVTWRASQPIGRSVALNLVVDESSHAFLELNRIAEAVVPAFALSAGEFGSPGPPTAEPRARPIQRYRVCPEAQLTASNGVSYSHFEVKGTSCHEALAIMRRYIHGERTPPSSNRVHGWTIEPSGTQAYLARNGRARFVCYINAG